MLIGLLLFGGLGIGSLALGWKGLFCGRVPLTDKTSITGIAARIIGLVVGLFGIALMTAAVKVVIRSQEGMPSSGNVIETSTREYADGSIQGIKGAFPEDNPVIRIKMSFPKSWIVKSPIQPDILLKVSSPESAHTIMVRAVKVDVEGRQSTSEWSKALGALSNGARVKSELYEALSLPNMTTLAANKRTMNGQPALDISLEGPADILGEKVFMAKRFIHFYYKDHLVSLEAATGDEDTAKGRTAARRRFDDANQLYTVLFASMILLDQHPDEASPTR